LRIFRIAALVSALTLSLTAYAQQPGNRPAADLTGPWYGVIEQWTHDSDRRDLVVNADGTCQWDLPKQPAALAKARSCTVDKETGVIELVTVASSGVRLQLVGKRLEGTFQLKGGTPHPVVLDRDPAFAASRSKSLPVATSGSVIVVNIGAWDCPYCVQWANTYKQPWFDSQEFKRVRYLTVESPTIKEAYNEKYWPDELKPYLKQVHGTGTPRFLVIKRGKIVSNQFGTSGWLTTLEDVKKAID
jgi:hypothetical protein